MSTGVVAWKLAKGLYLMPILFAYTAFLTGTPTEVALIFVVALLGVWALGVAIDGYFEAPVPWYGRLGLAAAGVALLWPGLWALNGAAAATVVALLSLNVFASRRGAAARATA